MAANVRLLAVGDLPAAWELGRIAFGSDREPPPGWLADRPGRADWGAFDDAGRLLAKAGDREQGHWFGGRLVPASGVAGVAVAPEVRGTGLSSRVLSALLAAARDRGAVISTLFRTHPGPYRSLGYEEVGALVWTALPTSALAATRRPPDLTLRPAEPADVSALLEAYRTVARSGSGLMERSGQLFDTSADAVLAGHDGITVAVSGDGAIEGYASWDRGPGYDASGRVSVDDLIGLSGPATTALLAMLGSWAGVAPTLRLRLPDPDPAVLLAPFVGATEHSRDPWMLRVLDAPAAVAARGWPEHVAGGVDLLLDDDVCPWNAGAYRLVIE
ncbi:MAG: GNAT family N-acetyltransferase, partial [Actinomycetota bacterium]|nr:GNAT family N-acetyltransferase [Actinomycetota bacterium]